MIGMILGILFVVLAVVSAFVPKNAPRLVRVITPCVSTVIAIVLVLTSIVVTLEPGKVGLAYRLNGSTTRLNVGYNFVPPFARVNEWNTTIQVFTFSQGEAYDDIYGAQTNEKDYIEVVATMSIKIDTEQLEKYIALYGNEQLTSKRIQQMLKTISREAIESSVNVKSTADVMGNKKQISTEAKEYLQNAMKDLPIVLVSFTVDDLIAPESYENAIKEQAQLRMDKEKAMLQQEINEQEALANKIRAEGESKVKTTQAQADAEVKRIEAENAAAVAKIQADNEAEVKKIQAEAEASVRRIKAEAEATEITTKANAEAEAVVKQGEAEAKAIAARGEAYKQNTQLIELKMAEITAEVQRAWGERWSGYSFDGMSGFNFANLTEIFQEILSKPVTPASN